MAGEEGGVIEAVVVPEAPPVSEPTKVCSRCGTEKPHSDFYRMSASKDGRQSQCKRCLATAQRESAARPSAPPPAPASAPTPAPRPAPGPKPAVTGRITKGMTEVLCWQRDGKPVPIDQLERHELIAAVRTLVEEKASFDREIECLKAMYDEKVRSVYHLVAATLELQIRQAVRDRMDDLLGVVEEEVRRRASLPVTNDEEEE